MPDGRFLEVEQNVELYYEDRGEGPPLLFVPGWCMSTGVFLRQIPHFSETHRVISFDPRSQGRSTVTLQGNDYATQSADLCKLIDNLELENPVLIGWSYGCLPLWGAVRLRGAAAFRGLVFVDMSPAPVSPRDDEWTEMSLADAAAFYQALNTSRGQRELVRDYTREFMVQRDLAPEELGWIVGLFTGSPHWVAAAYAAAGMFSDYLQEAQEVDRTLPSLFVVAEEAKDRAEAYLARQLPNAQAEFLGGHMMFWEYPEKFNAILEGYLKGLAES
jgi:pimeloyl-ACP methyl ester carboxylesterase